MTQGLIVKKLNNTLTNEEEAVFRRWYEESPEHREFFERMRERYEGTPLKHKDKKTEWERFSAHVGIKEKKKKTRQLYTWLAVASFVVLMLSVGIFFYKTPLKESNTITIGSSKAVLTLEDNTEVALEAGKKYNAGNVSSDGKSVVYTSDKDTKGKISYNYLTVPRGGEFVLELSDNTKIWLNSETKIKYPQNFIKGKPRTVELLYGEAYFDVSPATNHDGRAFKVATRNQEIKVLGTQFNISAYREDNAVTSTLVEGKVTVSDGNITRELNPGEQAIVEKNNPDIAVKKVDIYNYTAWKDGNYAFDDVPLKEIMQTLSRWYDVKVTFMDKSSENIRFTGVFGKNQSIRSSLSLIHEFDNNIEFEINGREIIVK